MAVSFAGVDVVRAERLLERVGDVTVTAVEAVESTNDVHRVETAECGRFFIKQHTAPWLDPGASTAWAVEREVAAHRLLARCGVPQPYRMWPDTSREVLPADLLISEEVPGRPVTEVLDDPTHYRPVLGALGRYLRRLHDIRFETAGALAPEQAAGPNGGGLVPAAETAADHWLCSPEPLQAAALHALDRCMALDRLPAEAERELRPRFERLADTLRPDYHPPRLVIGNCHPWHFHAEAVHGEWRISGVYDLESVSAGDATLDLLEMEVYLTTHLHSFGWREPFFEGYGRWPDFERYKLRLIHHLLTEIAWPGSKMPLYPDMLWHHWVELINASDWAELIWFPTA